MLSDFQSRSAFRRRSSLLVLESRTYWKWATEPPRSPVTESRSCCVVEVAVPPCLSSFSHTSVGEGSVGATPSYDKLTVLISQMLASLPVICKTNSENVWSDGRKDKEPDGIIIVVEVQLIQELEMVFMCLLPPGLGLWVGEECRALGLRLPLGTRSKSHVDSNRPKPRSTLGQVCMSSQEEAESFTTVGVHVMSIVDQGIGCVCITPQIEKNLCVIKDKNRSISP